MDELEQERFMTYLLKERQLSDRTVVAYMTFARLFNPYAMSQEYVNDFVIDHKNTSIIRAFIKHYLEFKGIPELFTLPKRPTGRKKQRVIRHVTNEELQKVKRQMYSTSFQNGLLFDILYEGALRRVEIVTITLGSFNWEEWFENPSYFCKLHIMGKGKKERHVLIDPETMNKILGKFINKYNLHTPEIIKGFMVKNQDVLLFRQNNGKPMEEKNVYDIIKKISKKAIGRDIRPHELRHLSLTGKVCQSETLGTISVTARLPRQKSISTRHQRRA